MIRVWRRDIAVENGNLQDIIDKVEDENTLVDFIDRNKYQYLYSIASVVLLIRVLTWHA